MNPFTERGVMTDSLPSSDVTSGSWNAARLKCLGHWIWHTRYWWLVLEGQSSKSQPHRARKCLGVGCTDCQSYYSVNFTCSRVMSIRARLHNDPWLLSNMTGITIFFVLKFSIAFTRGRHCTMTAVLPYTKYVSVPANISRSISVYL